MPTVSTATPARIFRFARFELQLDERRLLAEGRAVALGGHALDVLATLLARPGHLIGKAELLRAVWGQVVVEENTLQAQVSALRKVLGAEAIATVPGRGYRFALPVETFVGTEPSTPRHNLPYSLTSFIGREREMRQIREHLGRTRLLTLTGAGGCGKTRLAVEVCRTVVDAYADGVWLVELASLVDPTLLAQVLARTLEVEAQPGRDLGECVVEHLRRRQLLLVLDNAEHLLDACAAWAERLLQQCDRLSLLVTSRERLGIDGETAWRVPSLSLPLTDEREELLACEAARLFVDRAGRHRPGFEAADDEVAILVSVCRRLDGIALAIELAAAQMRMMSLKALHRGLDDRFNLLTSGARSALPRHRTLGALIAWSYERLAPAEQTLLRRAAVFAGGWTRQAAERVCSGEGLDLADIWPLLTALVDKNLVVTEAGGDEPRFGMLETVRHFALERLETSGERMSTNDRHFAYVKELAAGLDPSRADANVQQTLGRLLVEIDNVRAALAWCATVPTRVADGVQLLGLLEWFWSVTNQRKEGRAWIERLLSVSGGNGLDEAHAMLLMALGAIAADEGASDEAVRALRRAVGLYRKLGHQRELARSLGKLAWAEEQSGAFTAARACYEEVLSISREIDEPRIVALALLGLGSVGRKQGDLATARTMLEEARSVARSVGPWVAGRVSMDLGVILILEGALAKARDQLGEAAEMLVAFGDTQLAAEALCSLVAVCQDLGDLPDARRHLRRALDHCEATPEDLQTLCLGTAAGLLSAVGEPLAAARLWGSIQPTRYKRVYHHYATWLRPQQERLQHGAREAAGNGEAFDRASSEGEGWSLDQALRYARTQLQGAPG